MAYPEITIVNCTTGEVVVREMTKIEHDEKLADNKQNAYLIEKQKQDDTAKTVARQAVLDKLGLTADEVAALFG